MPAHLLIAMHQKWRWRNKDMRKLLSLISMLALASCSTCHDSAHDLKSDKPFEMYCPGGTYRSVWTIDPKLSEVNVKQVQLSDGYVSEPEFILVELTPSRFVLELEGDPDISTLIDRDTKKVFNGRKVKDKADASCRFKTL